MLRAVPQLASEVEQTHAPIVSILGARDLPKASDGVEAILSVHPSEQWLARAPVSVFGETDQNYHAVVNAFRATRRCVGLPVYVAVLKDAIVSPKGLVFTEAGQLVYESVYPWQLENLNHQFASDVALSGASAAPSRTCDDLPYVETAIHCREGGEVGYFHFINSILPRIAVAKRLQVNSPDAILASTYKPFASDLIAELGVKTMPDPNVWRRVGRLYYVSPFTFQGDHFTRPPFASVLLREVLAPIMPAGGRRRRVYLSRSDASVRRLRNEKQVMELLARHGFEYLTVGDMPILEQMRTFAEVECMVSAHGAGLSNMVFMPEGASVLEIVSPSRLWPTFRMLAARHGNRYHAVIGSTIDAQQTATKGEGNEDFDVNISMLRYGLGEMLATLG